MPDALPPVIVELKALIGDFKGGMGRAKTELEGFKSKANAALSAVSMAGKASAVGLAAIGVESVKMAANFQSSMTLLQTAGGESATNMGVVAAGIKNIAMQTGTSLNQLAEGMYVAEKASYRGADGLLVLKAAAEGAKAENVDLGTSVNALTDVMTDYHMSASQAVSAENMIVAASGRSKTTMADFASSLSSVVPLASSLHVSFAEVGGAIATMTQHGMTAQQTTQNLSNLFTALAGQNNVAASAMQQLGLNIVDLEKNLGTRGLTGTLKIVDDAIKEHTKNGMIVTSTAKDAALAMQSLNQMLGAMSPQLAALSQQYLSNKVSLTDYRKAVRDMGGTSAAQGLEFLSLAQSAQGFSDQLRRGQGTVRTSTTELQKMLGGMTGMKTALMLGGENAKQFGNSVRYIGTQGKKAGSDIATWGMTQKTLTQQISETKMMVEVAATDLGEKLIPAVKATVTWLNNHHAAAKLLAEVIGGALVAAIAAWVAKLAWGAATAVVQFAKMITAGTGWVATQAADIAESLALWSMYAAEWISTTVTAGAAWLAQQASQFAASIAAGAAWAAEHAVIAASYIAENVAMAASATAAFVAENAATLGLAAVVTAVITAVVLLATHWKQAWADIKRWTSDAYNNVIKPVGAFIVNDVLRPIGAGVKAYASLWVAQWRLAQTAISDAYNDVIRPVGQFIIDDVIHPIESAVRGYVSLWTGQWHAAETVVRDAVAAIVSVASKIIDWFTSLPGKIERVFSGALHLLYDAGKDIIRGLVNGIKSMAGAAVDAVKHVGSDIVGGAKKLLSIFSPSRVMADEVGEPISTGIAQGILAGGPTAVGAAEKVVSSVASALRVGLQHTLGSKAGAFATANGVTVTQNIGDALTSGLDSSLADMQKIGSQIPASIGSGISGGAGSATSPAKDLSNRIKTILGSIGSASSPQINVASTGITLVEKQLKHAGDALDEAIKHGLSAKKAAPLRDELKKLTEQANNQLTRLKAKIDTTDLKNLTKSLTGSVSDMQSAMSQLITDEKKAGAPQKVIDALRVSEQQLTAAMREQAKVANQLATAKQNLTQLEQSYKNQITQVTQALLQQADIGQMGSVTDAQGNTTVTLQAMLDQYDQQAQTDQAFMEQIKQLQGEGLNSTTVQQLIADGPAQAAQQVKLLASATKDQIAQINADTKSITTSGTGLGTLSASDMYSSGINAAQSLVSGLQARQKDLQQTVKTLAKGVKTLDPKDMKKEGVDAAKGLIKGLESQQSALVTAIRKIGSAMLAAFKESLDIHSPSRLMADQVGQPIVLGVVKGMTDSTPAAIQAARAVTGTVTRASVQQLEVSMPAGAGRAGAAAAPVITQTINVNATGTAANDPRALAAQIQTALDQHTATLVRELTAAGG